MSYIKIFLLFELCSNFINLSPISFTIWMPSKYIKILVSAALELNGKGRGKGNESQIL